MGIRVSAHARVRCGDMRDLLVQLRVTERLALACSERLGQEVAKQTNTGCDGPCGAFSSRLTSSKMLQTTAQGQGVEKVLRAVLVWGATALGEATLGKKVEARHAVLGVRGRRARKPRAQLATQCAVHGKRLIRLLPVALALTRPASGPRGGHEKCSSR